MFKPANNGCCTLFLHKSYQSMSLRLPKRFKNWLWYGSDISPLSANPCSTPENNCRLYVVLFSCKISMARWRASFVNVWSTSAQDKSKGSDHTVSVWMSVIWVWWHILEQQVKWLSFKNAGWANAPDARSASERRRGKSVRLRTENCFVLKCIHNKRCPKTIPDNVVPGGWPA